MVILPKYNGQGREREPGNFVWGGENKDWRKGSSFDFF